MDVKLPNFLIVGTAKAGTTSLYYYLKEHPEIYLSPTRKELRFFSGMRGDFKGPKDEAVNKSITKSLEEYRQFFLNVTDEKAIGDISPDYLYYYSTAVKNIKKYLKDPKIIIVLRNPVDRAFSQYLHFLRDGREHLSFEEAIKSERTRKESNWEWAWRYTEVGFYYKQVKAYLENFSEVRIYLYDDLRSNIKKILKDIFLYLFVDDSFIPSNISEKFNVSGIPKNKLLHKFLTKKNPVKSAITPFVKIIIAENTKRRLKNKLLQKNLEKPQMKPETREYLINLYREDILKLQDLIKRDLSHWLK